MTRTRLLALGASLALTTSACGGPSGFGGDGPSQCELVPVQPPSGPHPVQFADAGIDDATCARLCGDALPCVVTATDGGYGWLGCSQPICPM